MMKEYIQNNETRFLNELFEILSIPSVSSQKENIPDMQRCAEKLSQMLIAAGAQKAQVYPTTGHPVVYAERVVDPKLKTVLVYGHYDVQPVDPINLWKSDPFKPEIRDGAIYGRGANDDKGQTFMHVKVLEYLVKEKRQKHNIKFILEGEEEIGSPSLAKWVMEHKELLKCDLILVSDTTMISEKVPSINCGMRGLAYLEVEVTGPNKDLHSGHYGGGVYNPIIALCDMIHSLIDDKGHITVKGFYDDVVELSKEDRALLAKAPFDEKEYRESLDIDQVKGEEGYSTLERTGIRPCLDVCGIWGGYTGEGSKTVLPSKAHAKISMRLVPNQDSHKIAEIFQKHFESIAPQSVKVKVTNCHGGEAYVSPIDMPAYKAAEKAYETTFGKQPIPTRSGGSIPIIAGFEKILGTKSILMGFGLGEDAIHSPNENYKVEHFFKGIETIPYFYKYFAEMLKK